MYLEKATAKVWTLKNDSDILREIKQYELNLFGLTETKEEVNMCAQE